MSLQEVMRLMGVTGCARMAGLMAPPPGVRVMQHLPMQSDADDVPEAWRLQRRIKGGRPLHYRAPDFLKLMEGRDALSTADFIREMDVSAQVVKGVVRSLYKRELIAQVGKKASGFGFLYELTAAGRAKLGEAT